MTNHTDDIEIRNEVEEMEEETKPRGKKTRIIIAIAVILLLLCCVGLFMYSSKSGVFKSDNRLESSVAAQLGQLDGKSEAEIQEELNRVVEEGTMSISINVNPVFKNGTSEGTLEIENSPSNHYAQIISITVDETGEEVYNSGLIMPNYHIQTDKLSKALSAGTYDCTATFTAYDTSTDEQNPIEVGAAAAKITISVLS